MGRTEFCIVGHVAFPRGGRYRRSPPAHDDAHEPVVAFGGDLVSGGCEYLDGGTRRDLFGCCASRQSDLGLLGHHVPIERRVLGSLGPDGGSVEVHQHETCYEPHRNSPCQGSRHRNRHGSLLSESFGTVFRPVSSAAWGRKGDRSIFLSLASCLGHPRVMKKEPVPIFTPPNGLEDCTVSRSISTFPTVMFSFLSSK